MARHFNFEKTDFEYSLKNIAEPSKKQYLLALIDQTRKFVFRVRWKAFHILNPSRRDAKETFGFNTQKPAPKLKELELFESNMIDLIKNIEFHKKTNRLQEKLKEDRRKINRSTKVFIPADKTNNYYGMEVGQYKELLKRNIEKEFKRGPDDLIDSFDREDKEVAEELDIADRAINKMQRQEVFINLKDTKSNFLDNPQCRLIAPCKSELGKVSKKFLDNIVDQVRSKSGLNLWKNTQECVRWFKSVQNKHNHYFVKLDLNSYYPSITKENLTAALNWARQYVTITNDQERIIIQTCRAAVLSEGQTWVKKGPRNEERFSVTMGSYSGAEVCEVVTLHLLYQIVEAGLMSRQQVGGFRDDLLGVTRATPRQGDILKKKMHELFRRNGFGIEILVNVKHVDYLDVHFDLSTGVFKPFVKAGGEVRYVDKKSDHPPRTVNIIGPGVQYRLSGNSANQEVFQAAARKNQAALRDAGHDYVLRYDETVHNNNTGGERRRRKRNRNVTYFVPPFSMTVKTKIGRKFLKIIDESFPPTNALHKRLSRHNLKLSYSCMPNQKAVIKMHNNRLLGADRAAAEPDPPCSCTAWDCPMPGGSCTVKNCIYQAKVTSQDVDGNDKVALYIGGTADFRKRYASGHLRDLRHDKYRHSTRLATYVWGLKDEGTPYTIEWFVVDRGAKHNGRRCNLCLKEAYYILYRSENNQHGPQMCSINRRQEVFSVCLHRHRNYLKNS